MCEALCSLFQDTQKILRSCTDKHAYEGDVGHDKRRIHSRPGHAHDSVNECRVRPAKLRDNVGQRRDPESQLGGRSVYISREFLRVELIYELVE